MKYLPILDELFDSDTVIFLIIGFVVALLISLLIRGSKKRLAAFIICFVLYAVCEIISNFHSSYMMELALLFTGTIAIGGAVGFLISTIISKVKESR